MLRTAIESALRQGGDAVQHIVQDGGSTDGTLEMLTGYPHVEVATGPDENLYDAWNKGLARATGDIICILNSDDELPDGTFDAVRQAYAISPDADLVSGPVEVDYGDAGQGRRMLVGTPSMLDLREQDIGPGVPLTNGRYITRAMMERVGPFDIRYRAWSDRQFLMRLIYLNPKNTKTSHPLYRYVVHDGSLTFNNAAVNLDHLDEAVQMTRDGMHESSDPALESAYRRWHAWASRYLVARAASQANFALASRTFFSAFRDDGIWPVRSLQAVAIHWAERHDRLGIEVGNPALGGD